MVGFDLTSSLLVNAVTNSFGTKHFSSKYNFSWTKGETSSLCRSSLGGGSFSSYNNQLEKSKIYM
jgi:hypothetical protein